MHTSKQTIWLLLRFQHQHFKNLCMSCMQFIVKMFIFLSKILPFFHQLPPGMLICQSNAKYTIPEISEVMYCLRAFKVLFTSIMLTPVIQLTFPLSLVVLSVMPTFLSMCPSISQKEAALLLD